MLTRGTSAPTPEGDPQAALAGALAPAADALLADAREAADRALAASAGDDRRRVEQARAEAAAILEQARADGARAARRVATARVAGARREAGGLVLAAKRQAYESLRRAAVAALRELAATPGAPALAPRLEDLVRQRLGDGARVRREGPGELTVVGELDRRAAVLGPEGLVDQALEAMGPAIEGLWS